MNAREQILERIRTATARTRGAGGATPDAAAVRVVAAGTPREELLKLFLARWTALGGETLRPANGQAIAEWIERETPGPVVVDDDLPEAIFQAIPSAQRASEAGRQGVFAAVAGITRAQGAIAETGALLLHSGAGRARLASLAPPVHIALLHPDDILPDVVDALGRMGPGCATVWINSPSKTADIESIIIRGVHGPCRVLVAIVDQI